MISRAFLLGAALLASCSPVLCAQMTPAKITFRNPGPYTQTALEQVAGVHAGKRLSVTEVQQAAQKLIDTGYFDDVGVDSQGSATALNLIFILKPIPDEKMTPVGFENFVWLQPEELTAALAKGAPLFRGRLPEAGNQADAITSTLQGALAAKGVSSATIEHQETIPNSAQPLKAMEWRVSSPAVTIHAVKLTGVSDEFSPAIGKIEAKLPEAPFAMGFASDALPLLLLGPYHNAGFLDASLKDVHTAVASSTAERVSVDVNAAVEAGPAYRFSAIAFEASPLVSSEQWQAGAVLKAGDVASEAKLRETESVVQKAYGERGYIDAYVDEGATLDRAAHTVSYRLKLIPGEVYRLGEVQVLGLNPQAQAQFNLAWKLKPGDPYNATYVKDFLGNNTAMRALEGYSGSFQASGDPQTHLVSLRIRMVRAGGGS